VDEVGREAAVPRDFARANGEVYELNRQGKLNEQVLAEFAREHQYEEMTATIALFCGTKSEVIESLLKNASHEGLIVACKAAKISWATAQLFCRPAFLNTRFQRKNWLKQGMVSWNCRRAALKEP